MWEDIWLFDKGNEGLDNEAAASSSNDVMQMKDNTNDGEERKKDEKNNETFHADVDERGEVKHIGKPTDDEFKARIIGQAVTTVTINWDAIAKAEVYKVEKYHKIRGWEIVAWKYHGPVVIENLSETFAYRFRISALIYDPEKRQYMAEKISHEFIGSTATPSPTSADLYRAIGKGQQFLVKRILRQRPDLIECPGPNGYQPLANAIAWGESDIVDVLLTAGASVHEGNRQNGRTPLHLAFYHGHLPVVRILLNRKADLEAIDAFGMTPCHCAIDGNQLEILKFAIESGANIEASDACGWTLLMRCVVIRSDVSILKYLITQGADITAVDGLGKTAVDLARLYKNAEAQHYFATSGKLRATTEEEPVAKEA